MNKAEFLKAYNKLPNRDKIDLLAKLSKPWIDSGAITEVPKDVNVILELQYKSKEAERVVLNKQNSKFTPKRRKKRK